MPEIGECYSIAKKIPRLGNAKKVHFSDRFHEYLNKNNTIIKKDLLNFWDKPSSFGKSIWFPVGNNTLVSQLGMSGNWFLNHSIRDKKHSHLVIEFKKHTLIYSDPRMFGNMQLFKDKNKILNSYNWGIDPYLDSDKIITALNKMKKSQRDIKSLLLDQKYIFGIGNYLACEILFDALINPLKLGSELNDKNIQALKKVSIKIIKCAIKTGGFSFASGYYLPDGTQGNMAPHIKVYRKSTCPHCFTSIINLKIKGRSSYYCPKCQIK